MPDHRAPAPGDLTITLLSSTRPATLYGRQLNPGDPISLHASPGGVPFRIGRHVENPLVLGRPRNHEDADESISKTVCEIAFEEGLWGIRCLSTTHPIQLTERDRDEVLPRCVHPDLATRRVLVPPGARVSIPSPYEQYHLRITIDDHRTEPRLTRPLPKGGNPTKNRMPELSKRDRLILAAKFLCNNIPVNAVGDAEAAELATAVLARRDPTAQPVTRKEVEKHVYRWRNLLLNHGVEDLNGQQNTNKVGTQLLAWGVLAPSDLRELLP